MASIAVTFADNENGLITASFSLPDADMKRLYKAYQSIYLTIAGDDPADPNKDPIPPLPAHQVCNKIAGEFIRTMMTQVLNEEKNMIFKASNIKYLEVEQRN